MIIEAAPSTRSLERLPSRVVKFLGAYGNNRVIRNALIQANFDAEEQQRGWALLKTASGGEHPPEPPPLTAEERAVREASDALDLWDEPNFQKIKAILRFDYPDTLAYLFRGDLKARQGAESILSVGTLLERVTAIMQKSDPERASQNAMDREALAKLAKRGYTEKEWERLRLLLETARQSLPAAGLPSTNEAAEKSQLELYAWYKEWTTIARATIKRRDLLIALGLAKRKSAKKAAPEESEDPDESAAE